MFLFAWFYLIETCWFEIRRFHRNRPSSSWVLDCYIQTNRRCSIILKCHFHKFLIAIVSFFRIWRRFDGKWRKRLSWKGNCASLSSPLNSCMLTPAAVRKVKVKERAMRNSSISCANSVTAMAPTPRAFSRKNNWWHIAWNIIQWRVWDALRCSPALKTCSDTWKSSLMNRPFVDSAVWPSRPQKNDRTTNVRLLWARRSLIRFASV